MKVPDMTLKGAEPPSEYRYFVYNLDLTVARNNTEYACGLMNALMVQNIPDVNANLSIRFESPTNDLIPLSSSDTFNLSRGTDLKLNYFTKIYITNAAVGAGFARLVFGFNVEMRKLLRVTADMIQTGLLQQPVTIAAIATAIPAVALQNRINLLICNRGGATVYLGSATVTIAGATQGVPLENGNNITLNLAEGVVMYGIAAAPNVVNILEGS